MSAPIPKIQFNENYRIALLEAQIKTLRDALEAIALFDGWEGQKARAALAAIKTLNPFSVR